MPDGDAGAAWAFRDEHALAFGHHPKELPAREEELGALVGALLPLAEANVPVHAFVCGPVGSGKTVTVREAAFRVMRRAKALGKRDVIIVEVNCRVRSGIHDAVRRVGQAVDPHFPDRGFDLAETLDMVRKRLERRNANALVVLDEADVLLKERGNDLVYALTRFADEGNHTAGPVVGVVLISSKDATVLLDEAAASTFGRARRVVFKPYTKDALKCILAQRRREAINEGVVPDDALARIADEVARWGDARPAIERLHVEARAAGVRRSGRVTAPPPGPTPPAPAPRAGGGSRGPGAATRRANPRVAGAGKSARSSWRPWGRGRARSRPSRRRPA